MIRVWCLTAVVLASGLAVTSPAVARPSSGVLAPEQSLRPALRPGPAEAAPAQPAPAAPPVAAEAQPASPPEETAPAVSAAASLVPQDLPRPRARPGAVAPAQSASVVPLASTPIGLYPSLRPAARPPGVVARGPGAQELHAAPVAPGRKTTRGADPHNAREPAGRLQTAALRAPQGTGLRGSRGAVCGIPGLTGEAVSPIAGRVSGCGIANPVRLTAVAGVRLSQPATMDCETARALHTWVERGLKPAFGATGGGVSGLQIAGSYVCRTRNHRANAKISEHGLGRAVDISGIEFANGSRLSVLRDYKTRQGAPMRAAHRAACGIFGTTLGPGSDGMHEDHLHFDTARHRKGAYCR